MRRAAASIVVVLAGFARTEAIDLADYHAELVAPEATDCTSLADGTPCTDDNACTTGETCRGGSCLPPVSLTQPAGSPVGSGSNPRGVAAADVNGDGKLDLAVANYGGSNVSILLGNGAGAFSMAAGSPIATGVGPGAVAAGDWNRDGRPDLALPNASSGTVTILLGNGLGGFSQAAGSPIASGSLPFSLAVGDVNGDALLDLAVGNYGSDDVAILLGNGLGGFSAAAGSPVAVGTQPVAIAIGDVDGDGDMDVAAANTGSYNVTILLGNGNGGFSQATGSPVAVGTTPEAVAMGDWNADAKLDLSVANAASNNVTILLGNGAGGFSPAAGSPVAAGTTPTFIGVADVNEDGKLDLTVANRNSDNVTILLGKGSGGFSAAAGTPVLVGTTPISVAAGDLNADGKLDLALANFGSGNVTILLNTTTFASDGTVCDSGNACTLVETCRAGKCVEPVSLQQASGSPVAVGSSPFSAAAGDWNGDGKLDLAVPNLGAAHVTILLGNGSGGFGAAAGSPVAVGFSPTAVAAGDLNQDGKLDLAVTNSSGPGSVSILLGNGSGGFVPAAGSPVPVVFNPWDVAIGDVDRDGIPDLAVASYMGNSINILLGNGSGGFSNAAGSPFTVGVGPISVAFGDINGDGGLDLVVASYDVDELAIFLGDGSGGFVPVAGSPKVPGNGPRSVAISDVNDDGRLDIAVANFDDNAVAILLGNGWGGFNPAVGSPVAVGTGPLSVATADLNGDGAIDLVTTSYGTNDVAIFLGNGSGGFQSGGAAVGVGTQPTFAAVGDVNADGKLDLAVANAGSNNVTVLLGATCRSGQCLAPSFTQPSGSPVATGNTPIRGAAGDLNRDGRPDLAVSNHLSNDVTILLGNGLGGFSQAGSTIAVGTGPTSVVPGDLDLDGKLDLTVANRNGDSVTILLGNGAGGFAPAAGSPVATGSGPHTVAIGDLNGDGTLDLATSNEFSDDVTILLGDGAGGFTQAAGSPIAVGTGPRSVGIADLNGDGKLDLAVVNFLVSSVTILLGNGAGGFTQAAGSPVPVTGQAYSVAVADLNRDGKLDLALAHWSDAVTILLGDGAGGFSQAAGSPISVAVSPVSVTIGDLDGDGKLDLAVANINSDNVAILLGNGAGGFSHAPGSPVAVPQFPWSVAFTDMNADGRLDLAVVCQSNSVTILLNQTIVAPNGTGCDDTNVCTTADSCVAGACSGTPVPPPDEVDGVRVRRDGTNAVITWSAPTGGATSAAILRGDESALPVGPGGGDEVCLASNVPSNTLTWPDATNPAAGAAFWYLVRGDNVCGNGPYGFRGQNGVATVPRLSTTCP